MRVKEIFRNIITILFLLCIQLSGYAQSQQGFSYQAVIRNSSGTIIASQSIKVHILLTNQLGTITHYGEEHNLITTPQGIANLIIGAGNSKIGTLAAVPWQKGEIYIKVEVDPTGTSGYQPLGSPVKLTAVPYALFAENAKEVISPENAADTDPIFVVKNKAGQIVFAVYQTGVRVYVSDTSKVKGAKGGFAVGGFTSKSITDAQDFFSITPSSARIWFNDKGKGAKGGFAVGGFTSKANDPAEYFSITPDSARIHLKDPGKGAKGGFAVGGFTSKSANNYLQLTPENCFIGQEAGKVNTSGLYNSFIGYQSGFSNTSGINNVAIGFQSLYSNVNGFGNSANGYKALFSNVSGSYNIAFGAYSLYENTDGEYNVANGYGALSSNTIGDFNSAVGKNALRYNTEGKGNTAVGYSALYNNVTGRYNTAIGHNAFYNGTEYSNSTALGAGAEINQSNKIRLGDATIEVIEGQVGFTIVSDGRFKNMVKDEVIGLDFITRLRPIIYNFDTQKFDEFLMRNMSGSTKNEILRKKDYTQSKAIKRSGFVAQDLEKAAQESGFVFNGVHHPSNDNDNYSIDYSLLTVPLVKAVQELNAKNEEQQKEIELLKAELESIKTMLKK